MPFLGLFGTGEFTNEQRPQNWRETILKVNPNGDSPITALSSMMASEATNDPTFNWFYLGFEPRILEVENVGGHLAGDLVLNLSAAASSFDTPRNSGLYTRVGTLIFVPSTNEIMRCTANGTATTVTVERGFAGTVAQPIADGAQLTVMGSAHEEGSGAPRGLARTPVHLYNYTQIFKTPVEHTRTAAATKTRTGPQVQQDRMRALEWHMQDIERSFLMGRRSLSTGPLGKNLRTSGGFQQYVSTNVLDLGGVGTLTNLTDYFEQLFRFGKDTRIGFVGNKFISKMHALVKNDTQFNINDKPLSVYGMNLREFVTPFGSVMFRRHPILATDPFYSNSAWFISPENVKYRYITDTVLQENIQANDEDLKKDQYLTECGFEIHLEETHGLLLNL